MAQTLYYKIATLLDAADIGGITPAGMEKTRNVRSITDTPNSSIPIGQEAIAPRPDITKFGCLLRDRTLWTKNYRGIGGFTDVNEVDLTLRFNKDTPYANLKYRLLYNNLYYSYWDPTAQSDYSKAGGTVSDGAAMADKLETLSLFQSLADPSYYDLTHPEYTPIYVGTHQTYEEDRDYILNLGYLYSDEYFHWYVEEEDKYYYGRIVNIPTEYPLFILVTTPKLTDYPVFFGCYVLQPHVISTTPSKPPTTVIQPTPTATCTKWYARLSQSTCIGVYMPYDNENHSWALPNLIGLDNPWFLSISSEDYTHCTKLDNLHSICLYGTYGKPISEASIDTGNTRDAYLYHSHYNDNWILYDLSNYGAGINRSLRGNKQLCLSSDTLLEQALEAVHNVDPNLVEQSVFVTTEAVISAWLEEGCIPSYGYDRTYHLDFAYPTGHLPYGERDSSYCVLPCCQYVDSCNTMEGSDVGYGYCICPYFDFLFVMSDGSVINVNNIRVLPENPVDGSASYEESDWAQNTQTIPQIGFRCSGEFYIPYSLHNNYNHDPLWGGVVSTIVQRYRKYWMPGLNDWLWVDKRLNLTININGILFNIEDLLDGPTHGSRLKFHFLNNNVKYGLPERHVHEGTKIDYPEGWVFANNLFDHAKGFVSNQKFTTSTYKHVTTKAKRKDVLDMSYSDYDNDSNYAIISPSSQTDSDGFFDCYIATDQAGNVIFFGNAERGIPDGHLEQLSGGGWIVVDNNGNLIFDPETGLPVFNAFDSDFGYVLTHQRMGLLDITRGLEGVYAGTTFGL